VDDSSSNVQNALNVCGSTHEASEYCKTAPHHVHTRTHKLHACTHTHTHAHAHTPAGCLLNPLVVVEQSLQQFSEEFLHVVFVRLVDYPLGKAAECPACDGANKCLREEGGEEEREGWKGAK